MKAFILSYIDRLARWFRDVLGCDSNQSSMRLVLLASWASVLLVFVFLSFKNGKMEPIQDSVLGLLTIVTSGKCFEKHVENRAA